MKGIVVTSDDLNRLERRFGPDVRRMGPWNSDGTFGYTNVSIAAVERAVETLENPDLARALSYLKAHARADQAFIELLETHGRALVEAIVVAYRECSLAAKPPQPETRTFLVARAAG
jgi:hypothetical protein